LLVGQIRIADALGTCFGEQKPRQALPHVLECQRTDQLGVTPKSPGHEAQDIQRNRGIRDEGLLYVGFAEKEHFGWHLSDCSGGIGSSDRAFQCGGTPSRI
jgi:hypothetical protein